MKKVFIFSKLFTFLILFSCNRTEQKNTNSSLKDTVTINQCLSVDTIDKKNIAHFDAIKIDTIISNYNISYLIRDNDDIISRQAVTSKGDSILLEYADRSVFISLTYNGQAILSNKEINKQTFASIIPKNEIKQYQLWLFYIKKVEVEGVLFNVNICMPDTDICYFIALYIAKSGDFTISKIEQYEDETDD